MAANTTMMQGEVLMRQGIIGNREKVFLELKENSDFIVYNDPLKTLEIFKFKSTICWVSSTAVTEKGVFVINDSQNCCVFFFDTGTQKCLERWLETFQNTGWKLSIAVNSSDDQNKKNNNNELYQHQPKRGNQLLNRSHDQSISFDPSQLKYESLSLSSSCHFNGLEMIDRHHTINNSTGTVTFQNTGVVGEQERKPSMERSVSLPSLLQPDFLTQTATKTSNKDGGGDVLQTQDISQNEVKLRQPIDEKQDGSGVRLRAQNNLYRRSNAAESGYCSKESLLITEAEKSLPSPSKSKQFILEVPYTNNDSNHRLSSSNSSSVFGEDKQSPTPNGLKESQKYFVNNSDHNGIGTLHLDEEEDIFDTKGIIREATINHFDQENENEATPKMEKKASVSQLFSNIKSKFGSTSSRKRVKKTTKSFTSDASYSSRLLWKHNGEWLDRWFNYTDGILAGYKDPTTAKPAEISIDVRTCKLTTLCHRQSIVKDLNLFQLTTPDELSHIFISWNEDQYRSWLECLSLAVELKDELYGLRFEHPTNGFSIEDTGETDIIPYVRSPESESIKVTTSSSSEASGRSGHHGRVDSIDSGNDGDESGLESSLSSSKRMTDIRRAKSEKIDKKIRGPRISEGELVKSKSTSKIDLFRKFSHESTSTDNDVLSPTIEFNGHPLTASLNVPTEIGKKKQRGSFIQKKFGFFDSKSKKDDKVSTPTIDNSKRVNSKSSLSSQSMQSSNMAVSPPKDIETSDNHSYKRPNSLDISSVSTLSTWEGFGGAQTRFKKMSCGSEDDMSSTYSAPSVIDDKVSEDVEDALREETLLRKRRNSLTLERTQIVSKLDVLREADNLITNTINNNLNQQNSSKKHSKVSFSSQPIEKTEELVVDSEKKKAKITLLEEKIDNIDCEIEDIDKRIFNQRVLASDDKQWTQQKHSKPFTKLRLNPKTRALYDMNSQSFESLSSSASRESTISRGDHIDSSSRPPVKNHFIKPKPIQIPKTPDSEDGGHSNSSWNGMEELMITAQRLESTSSNGTEEIKQSSPVGIWRSKSLGSVELLKNKSMRMDINQNTSASTIIEDFEKFSEMLTNQSKVKQPQQPIDV